MISPPIDLSAFTPATFQGLIDSFVADATATVRQPVTTLLHEIGSRQIHHFLAKAVPGEFSHLDVASAVLPTIAGSSLGFAAAIGMAKARQISHKRKTNRIFSLIQTFSIERPVNLFKHREQAVLVGMARLIAANAIKPDDWAVFLARLAWADGLGTLVSDEAASHAEFVAARTALHTLLTQSQPKLETLIGDTASLIGLKGAALGSTSSSTSPSLKRGLAWLPGHAIDASPYLHTQRSPASLFLGRAGDTRAPVYFNGHESLITIGGPGTGKSQAQVIPNLLTYPGSAIVLDVKGELWDATAGHRQATFGPVYKFAPTDPTGRTHRYNPFDFVSRDPQKAAIDCEVFSYQIIAPNPDLKDPYWENRARDFLWAFAVFIATCASDDMRRLERLSELAAIQTEFPDLTKAAYLTSETAALIDLLRRLAVDADIPDLAQAATAIYSGLTEGQRLTSVFDNARRHLSRFARSQALRNAMSASDWSPNDFRTRPGTTLYICIPSSDLAAYAGVVRLIFAQHVRILSNYQAKPDEPPITIFLDEMPHLGKFEDVMRLQDVGRGAGLRLWMFAQYLGQIRGAYGQNLAGGLLEANRIRCYIQPDTDTATVVAKALGDTVNELTGEKQPLATVAELGNSPKYTDKIITSIRGHQPIILDKHEAWRKMAHLVKPPPLVPIAG